MKSRDDMTAGETPAPITEGVASLPADGLMAHVRPLREVEEEHVQFALRVCNGNKKRAAEALGISRDTLYRKLADLEERLVQTGGRMHAGPETTS